MGVIGWDFGKRYVLAGSVKRTDLMVGAEERAQGCDVWRDVEGKGEVVAVEDQGCEGVGAIVQHALGVAFANDDDLAPEVEQHGVGLPAANELDGVVVDAGAQ